MKLTLNSKLLATALLSLKSIAKPNGTHPELSNVVFKAEGETLTLIGMDLEKQLTIRIPCKVDKPGATTISCAKMSASVATLSDADLTIETDDKNQSKIKCAGYQALRPGLAVEDMPPFIESKDGVVVTIPIETLNAALKKSLLFCATQVESVGSRAHLRSVQIVSSDGKLRIQGTAGPRVLLYQTVIEYDSKIQCFIPADSIPAMSSLSNIGDAKLSMSSEVVSAETDVATFSTRLIEGQIQDLAKVVIPTELPIKITANRVQLLDLIGRVSVDTSENARGVDVTSDGKKLTIRAQDGNDVSQDSMAVKKGSGKIAFGINPDFLRDALKCMDGDEVTIECKDEMTAIVLREGPITCVISPMKIGKA